MDKLHSYCVLEDDVLFRHEFPGFFEQFQQQLPVDWDQMYLGGQHLKTPTKVTGFVWRGNNVNRTHAYCIKHTIIEQFQRHIMDAPGYIRTQRGWHIDHQLGSAHERKCWNTYCPGWWLAGQRAGVSNISGRQNPSYWWHPTHFIGSLPFIHCSASPSPEVVAYIQQYIHFGNNLKPGTLQDVGLDACVKHSDSLAKWLRMIAGEALDREQLPGIQHPGISRQDVADCGMAIVPAWQSADIQRLHTETYEGLRRQSLE